MIKRKGYFKAKRGQIKLSAIKRPSKRPGALQKATGARKRRKKGEITKLKEQLWLLCRQITKAQYGNTCYTCGRVVPDGKGMHTAHYLTSSLCSIPLRFDLRNLKPGCYHCNINLSGNWPAYKKAIEAEMGPEITAQLIKENEETKGKVYPKEWFETKIAEYTAILKDISTT